MCPIQIIAFHRLSLPLAQLLVHAPQSTCGADDAHGARRELAEADGLLADEALVLAVETATGPLA